MCVRSDRLCIDWSLSHEYSMANYKERRIMTKIIIEISRSKAILLARYFDQVRNDNGASVSTKLAAINFKNDLEKKIEETANGI